MATKPDVQLSKLRFTPLDENPLGQKIILMGMSCVGKTTFAHHLTEAGYHYRSFDKDFAYTLQSMGGVSLKKNWTKILKACSFDKPYVLDNWTTEDNLGRTIRENDPLATICVLFDSRKKILGRYRVPVVGEDAFRGMYEKMYCRTKFEEFHVPVRYIRVEGTEYTEYNYSAFRQFIDTHLDEDIGMIYNAENRRWTRNVF